MQLPRRGLYAITDVTSGQSAATVADQVSQAIAGGAVLIQYRDKVNDRSTQERIARALLAVCHASAVPLIINDDLELARRIGSAGVHLGKHDMNLPAARALLGRDAIIGVSCYNELERARVASREGASYVAFGRFFASRTKPNAVQAELDLLRTARSELAVPLVAIGGITPGNAPLVIEAGADFVAVIQGVFGQPDIAAAARRFACLFEQDRNMPAVAQ